PPVGGRQWSGAQFAALAHPSRGDSGATYGLSNYDRRSDVARRAGWLCRLRGQSPLSPDPWPVVAGQLTRGRWKRPAGEPFFQAEPSSVLTLRADGSPVTSKQGFTPLCTLDHLIRLAPCSCDGQAQSSSVW